VRPNKEQTAWKQDGQDRRQERAELLPPNALKAVCHGQDSTRSLKELARSYGSLQQDSTRVMNRLKGIFSGRSIPCCGTSIYLPANRKEWLEKLKGNGAQLRAELLLMQLESLAPLCLGAQIDLVRESRKHQSYKILRGIPGLGPIRVELIQDFVATPHRFRNKRQFWIYAGFHVIRRGSTGYEITQGELKRANRSRPCQIENRGTTNLIACNPLSRRLLTNLDL
jgi:transposase